MYNTKNLYNEMDRRREMYIKAEMKANRRKRRFDFLKYVREYAIVLLAVFTIGGVFVWKHDGNVIQNTIDYFENFDNPNFANRGKEPLNYRRDIVVEDHGSKQQSLVPVINIEGELKRDGADFIIFKHNGKEYTLQVGETFADGKYILTGISNKEMEVTDNDGNYFYYEIPNRRHVKK